MLEKTILKNKYLKLFIIIILFIFSFSLGHFVLNTNTMPLCWSGDPVGYNQYAVNLLAGIGYCMYPGIIKTARVPIYPFFLSLIFYIGGHSFHNVAIYQIVLFSIINVLVIYIGYILFNLKTGILASSILMLLPEFLSYSISPSPEMLFSFFLVLSILLFIKGDKSENNIYFMLSGIFFGLATLTRLASTYLCFFILIIGIILFLKKKINVDKIKKYSLALLLFFLTITPWIVRNSVVEHRLVLLTSSSGLVDQFIISVNRYFQFDETKWMSKKQIDNLKDLPKSQVGKIKFIYALKYRLKHPGIIIKNYKNLWGEYATQVDLGALLNIKFLYGFKLFYFILPFIVAGFILLFLRFTENWILLSVFLYFNIMHIIIFSDPRYRIPFMPFMTIFAAYTINYLFLLMKRGISNLISWKKF